MKNSTKDIKEITELNCIEINLETQVKWKVH